MVSGLASYNTQVVKAGTDLISYDMYVCDGNAINLGGCITT